MIWIESVTYGGAKGKIKAFVEKVLRNAIGGSILNEILIQDVTLEDLKNQIRVSREIEEETVFLLGLKEMGTYREARGHHIHIKSEFEGHVSYDPNEGFSISQQYMKENDWSHKRMTAEQQRLFKELYKSGRTNTLREHTRIATEALKCGWVPENVARELVAKSLWNLRTQGVRFPTRIPWFTNISRNPKMKIRGGKLR